MNLLCNHDWVVLTETVTKAPFEVAMETCKTNGTVGKTTIPHQMCTTERKYIVICTCNKCGKIKKFVENLE
jgi:hypothetical protein